MKLHIFPYETTEIYDVKLHNSKMKLQYEKNETTNIVNKTTDRCIMKLQIVKIKLQ